jgi:hypothetical protein
VKADASSLRSVRYLSLAKAYHRAASAIADSPGFESLRLPFFAVLGQAAELALKAAIARGGGDDDRLLLLGHDLVRCWDLARATADPGEICAAEIASVVESIGAPHHAQAFRYPTLLSWPLPDPRKALRAVAALLAINPEEPRGAS